MKVLQGGISHISVIVCIVLHGLEESSPQLCARVAAVVRVKTKCVGATVLDAFDDACVNVRCPATRFAEVIVDEELNDALDGSKLIPCVKSAEKLRLHRSNIVEAGGHGHSLDLGKGTAQVVATVIA